MPLNLFPGFIFGTIIYWIVDLNNARYGYFILILLLEIVTAIALGLAVSAVSPNPDVATGIAIPCVIIPLLFAGFYSKCLRRLRCLPLRQRLIFYVFISKLEILADCCQLDSLGIVSSLDLPGTIDLLIECLPQCQLHYPYFRHS